MFIRLFALSAFILGLVTLSGCATDPESKKYPEKERVSTIPWNKPASWEGQGAMGGVGQALGGGGR